MRILIGYDGSESADAVLDDLRRAAHTDCANRVLSFGRGSSKVGCQFDLRWSAQVQRGYGEVPAW